MRKSPLPNPVPKPQPSSRNSQAGAGRQVQASPSQPAGAQTFKRAPAAGQTAKQSSADNLSASFESDYDLLVYLGETETEDLVDTERSLDYQDQTWRQSICGASLAPTIDDSLGELLADRSSSRLTISTGANLRPVRAGSSADEATPTLGDQQFFRSKSALSSDSPVDFYPALPDRARTLDTRQLGSQSSPRPLGQDCIRGTGSERAMTQPADELDRLLAEMSQSLDLESLAKFDTQPKLAASNQSAKKAKHASASKLSTDSILDELDGASRMLEQMIGEQAKYKRVKPINQRAAAGLPEIKPTYPSQPSRAENIETMAERAPSVIVASAVPEAPSQQTRPSRQPHRKSIQVSKAPTPPAVDYEDDKEVSHESLGVLHVEACVPSSDSETDHQTNDQLDRIKQRTLTGMRSMRAKLSDFVGNLGQPQQALSNRQASRSPIPPSRSSSIGSRNKPTEDGSSTPAPARQSRRDDPSKRSFGKQIRDRLSRSKTRFMNKFMRAQSSPNTKPGAQVEKPDEDLFEPGDIARNSDSRDSSLDRHLKRDIERRTRRSSESELEGLEETNHNRQARNRRAQRRFARNQERPRSLLSLKRLKLINWRSPENNQQSDGEGELRRALGSHEPTPAVFSPIPDSNRRQIPSRSQSLRLHPASSQAELGASSANSLVRRLPTSTNSFRPASALASPSRELEITSNPPREAITPVEPTSQRVESVRPAQLDASNTSLRTKGASSLLGDLRQRLSPSTVSDAAPLPPPAKPPRRRSKSMAAKSVPAQPLTKPNQNKLATLAQQICHSAVDFFHAGPNAGKSASSRRSNPIKAQAPDFCEWKPVVGRQALEWSSPKGKLE